jgi:hypothetical protein
MKRTIPVILAVFVFAAIALADDVWKSKPYQQWDSKDVQKILNDSPWVRVVRVEAKWQKPGAKGSVPVEPGGTSPGNYGTQAGTAGVSGRDTSSVSSPSAYGMPGGPTNANSGSLAQNAAILNSGKIPETTFMLRWFSALSVRQALSRAQVLAGAMTEADAAKALSDEPIEYAVAIAGPDMTPFVKTEEKDIAAKSWLQPKKGDKIPAARVVIQRVPNSKPEDPRSIAAVVVYFSKKIASGEPALSPNVKNVDFACESGGATIKASFDLSKMAAANGPDW